MLQGLYFGALLNYRSPIDGYLTRCVYVRGENNRAVVIFDNAEKVARVDYGQLEWPGSEIEEVLKYMKQNLYIGIDLCKEDE